MSSALAFPASRDEFRVTQPVLDAMNCPLVQLIKRLSRFAQGIVE